MQVDFIFRDINDESHESTSDYVKKQVEKHLQAKLERFNTTLLRLHATIEWHKNHYNVTFRLLLPLKKVLVIHESDSHLRPAVDVAIDKLGRRVEKHYAHISGKVNWSRKARRKQMKELAVEADLLASQSYFQTSTELQPQAPQAPQASEDIEQLSPRTILENLLPRLASYIKHEMTYLRANGYIQDNYPTVTDILDESYLKLSSQIDTGVYYTEGGLYQALLKSTTELLQREINYAHDHEKDVSIESPVPKDAQQQAEDMVEEEIFEFYQSDEALHIEDLMPTRTTLFPEQQLQLEAIDSCYQLMATMPNQWRQVVTLVYREQVEIVVISETILNIPVDQITDTLNKAEAFIHTHLEEQGLAEWADLAVLLKS